MAMPVLAEREHHDHPLQRALEAADVAGGVSGDAEAAGVGQVLVHGPPFV